MNTKTSIKLGSKLISKGCIPYVIAEIGVNHEGSIDLAKKLIDLAKQGGADAAKFQSYKAGKLASKNSPAYWDTKKEPTLSQFELFQKYDAFNDEDYRELAIYCEEREIDFISTPFDEEGVEFLSSIAPFFKIASADITNIPLLRKVAKTAKPVLLSTGASNLEEIKSAVECLNRYGCEEIVLLHCILNYPTLDTNANLKMIDGLAKAFPNILIGYSDHTLPNKCMTTLVASQVIGAVVIEKHFTHNKSLPGNDHYHAMDVDDLRQFKLLSRQVFELMGESSEKKPIATEEISRLNARRSLVLNRDIVAGHVLTENDLTCKRPGTGIGPENWDKVIGRIATKNMSTDEILQWIHLSPND